MISPQVVHSFIIIHAFALSCVFVLFLLPQHYLLSLDKDLCPLFMWKENISAERDLTIL